MLLSFDPSLEHSSFGCFVSGPEMKKAISNERGKEAIPKPAQHMPRRAWFWDRFVFSCFYMLMCSAMSLQLL